MELISAFVVFIVLLILLYLFRIWTDKMVFFPFKQQGMYSLSPETYKMNYEDIWLHSDKDTIHGWFIHSPLERPRKLPKSLKLPEIPPTIIFFHGNAGFLAHRLDLLSLLNMTAANILAIDYRGYGLSSGKTKEKTTYTDAQVAIEFVLNRPDLQSHPIILFGRSLGGGVAVELARRFKGKIAGLILEATFTSVADLVWEAYRIPFSSILMRTSYNSKKKITNLDLPLLLIHGTRDKVVPYKMSEKLYDLSSSHEKRLLKVEGGNHENQFLVAGENYLREWIDFYKKVLKYNQTLLNN